MIIIMIVAPGHEDRASFLLTRRVVFPVRTEDRQVPKESHRSKTPPLINGIYSIPERRRHHSVQRVAIRYRSNGQLCEMKRWLEFTR